MEATVKALHTVRSEALDSGIRIAIENHAGDMQAREVKSLIEAAGKIWKLDGEAVRGLA